MPLIPFLIAALLQAARMYLPGLLGRVLLAFGIGLFTHQVALPALLNMLQSFVIKLPPIVLSHYYALGLDVAATAILSAIAANRAQSVILKKLGAGA